MFCGRSNQWMAPTPIGRSMCIKIIIIMMILTQFIVRVYLRDQCRYSRFWSSRRLGRRRQRHAGMTVGYTARTTDLRPQLQTQRLWLPWQRRRLAAMTSRWCKARASCERRRRSEAVRCGVRCLATPWRRGPKPPSKLWRHNTTTQNLHLRSVVVVINQPATPRTNWAASQTGSVRIVWQQLRDTLDQTIILSRQSHLDTSFNGHCAQKLIRNRWCISVSINLYPKREPT